MSERLTIREAAAIARVTPATLRQAIHRGRLKAEQEQTPRGPVWYTTCADLARYLEGRPDRFKRQERQRAGREGDAT